MNMSKYNYAAVVDYTTNREYRACFRSVFNMDENALEDNLKQQHYEYETYEDETKDELIFDETLVNEVMGEILENTGELEPFRELYKKAAALVFSQVADIGLAILLSYDYFHDFHALLGEFYLILSIKGGDLEALGCSFEYETFLEQSEPLKRLYARFKK
jgi:hypothetical protein